MLDHGGVGVRFYEREPSASRSLYLEGSQRDFIFLKRMGFRRRVRQRVGPCIKEVEKSRDSVGVRE